MKICPLCKSKYPEDANFCPLESCATEDGPQRLESVADAPEPRFKPIERIGGGSTGEVWRARDGQTGGEIALKLVNPQALGSPMNQSRVEREFKQLMRVSSPTVATIIDCGKTPDQRLLIAMELFPGESLANVLRAGPVDLDAAKALIGQVGQALLETQRAGLVHRDVSPKNVLVGPTGEVKVINFPLAEPITDKVAGDPAYISPEQAQGKPADQRSNIYSLAAILYHLLTGEPPFQASTTQGVLDMHVSSPVLPPSQKRPDAKISVEADRLILKGLDKSSSRRHLTLRLFLTELEGIKTAAPDARANGLAKPGGEVGLARTMLFAGNQADVARMVAEAKAAKAAPSASVQASAPGPAVAAAPAPRKHEAKVPVPAAQSTISVMDTLAADAAELSAAPVQPAPAASSRPVVVAPSPAASPPAAVPPSKPVAPAQQQPAAAPRSATPARGGGVIKPAEAGAAPPPKAGAAFRETLWFKKGDVEQMVADAKAKLAAAGRPGGEAELPADDARPIEERYVDDGSVTTEDRKKFSLRTGGTATAMPATAAAIPGKKMDERELVHEIARGRRMAILLVAVVVVVALAVVVAMMKGRANKKAHFSNTPLPAAARLNVPPPAVIPSLPPARPPAAAIPTPTAASPRVRGAAIAPAAQPKKAAKAQIGIADDDAKPSAGGAVSGAEHQPGKKPGKAKAQISTADEVAKPSADDAVSGAEHQPGKKPGKAKAQIGTADDDAKPSAEDAVSDAEQQPSKKPGKAKAQDGTADEAAKPSADDAVSGAEHQPSKKPGKARAHKGKRKHKVAAQE